MNRGDYDIKAPDGFTLGGWRRVHKDGSILFQRGYWQAPKEWAGQRVHVHCTESGAGDLEVAPPGQRIYQAQLDLTAVSCPRTARPDAKPGYRKAIHKAWHDRKHSGTEYETCRACGGLTHMGEAACLECGSTKEGR